MNFFEDGKQRDDLYAAAWSKLHGAHMDGAPADMTAAAAAALLPLVTARIAALHEALAGLGLPVAEIREDTARVIGITEKVVQIAFLDTAGNREINMDLTWNGHAFLAGRRYEASMSRVSLSDAEIARTAILRVDIDRAGACVVITFLTLDGRDARIRINARQPFDPIVEGVVPQAALEALGNRPATASLAHLCRNAAACAERAGANKGFFSRLLDGPARQARADFDILSAYLAGQPDAKSEPDKWSQSPQVLKHAAEALIRRLSLDGQIEAVRLIRVLIVVAVGRILAAGTAPPAKSG